MTDQKAKSKKLKIFLYSFLFLFVVWLALPYYLRTALTYWFPGIEDYKIFHNRVVEAGDRPLPWPKASNYNKQVLPQPLRDTLEKYKSIAYLVIQDDSIVFEKYWEGFGTDSYSNSFSAAKSIVSLLIGAAVDEGKIKSVDEPAFHYLPHLTTKLDKELTIRDLLTMSSGSNWDESYSSPLSMTTQAYYGDDIAALSQKIHIVEQPGKYFSYKSGDTELLSLIVKAATGKTLSDYASEKLWQPMGAEHDALWSLDRKDGVEKAYCCFNSNARDFARFGKLVLNKGSFAGKQLVSEKYIKEATTPASYLLDEDGKPCEYYGLQWWIMKANGKRHPYMRGILGQYVITVPEKNAIIVRLGHKRSKSYIDHHPADAVAYLREGLKLLK
jgi:CubicO group peptidase (beta-lactamase class C family)